VALQVATQAIPYCIINIHATDDEQLPSWIDAVRIAGMCSCLPTLCVGIASAIVCWSQAHVHMPCVPRSHITFTSTLMIAEHDLEAALTADSWVDTSRQPPTPYHLLVFVGPTQEQCNQAAALAAALGFHRQASLALWSCGLSYVCRQIMPTMVLVGLLLWWQGLGGACQKR